MCNDVATISNRLASLEAVLDAVQARKNASRVQSWRYHRNLELTQQLQTQEREYRQTEARSAREQKRREWKSSVAAAKKKEEEFAAQLREEEAKSAAAQTSVEAAPTSISDVDSKQSDIQASIDDFKPPEDSAALESFYDDAEPGKAEGEEDEEGEDEDEGEEELP